LNVGAGPNITSGTAGLTFAGTLTGAGVINTQNSFFHPGAITTTTLASLTGAFAASFGGTGNTTITGGFGTGITTVTKSGNGTLTLGGANLNAGTVSINAGTLAVAAGGSFTTATNAVTFGTGNTGTGRLLFNSASAGATTQGFGALTFNAGSGTVESVLTAGGTSTTLTFASLGARAIGSTGHLITNGGTNGVSNSIVFTAAPAAGLINIGGVFMTAGGVHDFAYSTGTASSAVRLPVYGTDAGFNNVAAGALTQLTATSTRTRSAARRAWSVWCRGRDADHQWRRAGRGHCLRSGGQLRPDLGW
jgi:fibronectin-binding autotransporter adhesin